MSARSALPPPSARATDAPSTGAPDAGPDHRPLPLAIYVLAAGTFLMGTTEFVVAGLLPEMAATFGRSEGRTGLAITVFAVGMIVGAPTVPLLALRLPQRLTLTLALGAFAASHVVLALTDGFGIFLTARVVAGVATGTFWAVASTLATRIAGPRRSSGAMGIVVGGGMLATVLGVPLGSFAGQAIGWRGPFWVLAALAAAEVVVLLLLVESNDTPGATPSLRSELAALRSTPLWLTLSTCAAVNAGVLSVYSYISPTLTGRSGLSSSAVPVALALFGVGAVVGSVVGGRMGDAHPFRTPLLTAGVTLVTCAALVVASTSVVVALAAFTVLGFVGLSGNPVLVSLVARYGGEGATLPNAMAPAMFNVGTAVGTAVTGAALGSSLGDLAPPVVGLVSAALVFVPLGALVLRERGGGRPPVVRRRRS